jgi:hypothetical protein
MYLQSSLQSQRMRTADPKRARPQPLKTIRDLSTMLPRLLWSKAKNTDPATSRASKPSEIYFINPQRIKPITLGANSTRNMSSGLVPANSKSDSFVSATNGPQPLESSSTTSISVLTRMQQATMPTVVSAKTNSNDAGGNINNSSIKPADYINTAIKSSLEIREDTKHVALPSLKILCCDKCDGKHETDNCPHYKRKRDDHPDAQRRLGKQIGGTSTLPGSYLPLARVVRQPGDGSCLFHSLSYGLRQANGRQTAQDLRHVVSQFIRNNPSTMICDTPLQDWVRWDSNSSVPEYSQRIAGGAWGGGIEMACLSLILLCNIHVYERHGVGYRRISAFDCAIQPKSRPIVRVLYCGGVHYGKLVAAQLL